MKTFFSFFLIFLLALNINAQVNLVPNSSFEDTIHCPDLDGELNKSGWINPTATSPDYFNSCAAITTGVKIPQNSFGYQFARIGDAYAGIYVATQMATNGPLVGREYIQHVLSDTLETGKNYSIEFYVSRADYSTVAITEIGAFLSKLAISSTNVTNLSYTPQIVSPPGFYITDTLSWTKISGTYLANGGEKYITIGNFKDETTTDTLNMPVTEIMGHFSYYYIEDVNVTLLDTSGTGINEHNNEMYFNLYPNPNNGNMVLDYTLASNDKGSILIYDITGKLMVGYVLDNSENKLAINNGQLNNGIYFYHIVVNNKIVKSDKIVIIK